MSTAAPPSMPLPVLVVDDDNALIRTLSDILRLHGYAPAVAVTGREGIARARETAPVLAVVDLRLPDMDGMELVARLQEVSALTEVVVLTGNASVESAVAALRQKSVDYLLKPVQVPELLRVASRAGERWMRRAVEEKLRAADERFRAVAHSELLGIMFWNFDGRILDSNDAFLGMVGYSREELEAGDLNWARITPPEWAATDAEKAAELLANGHIAPYEKEYVRRNGERVPILIGASVLPPARDHGVAFIVDISDRKRTERALVLRARQQAAVAAFGHRAIVAQDIDAVLDDAVSLVSDTLGVPMAAVLERKSDGRSASLRAAIGWPASDVGRAFADLDRETVAGFAMATTQPSLSVAVGAGVGGAFPGAASLREQGIRGGATVPIPGAVQPYGILCVHTRDAREFTQDDLHFMAAIAHVAGTAVERHRAEAGRRQAQRMEAVGQLAGSVAHDFNNMLTAISGYGEIIRSALRPDDPLSADVGEILKASKRAAALTRQLLAFSRQQVLAPRPVNINEVLTQLEGMLRRLIVENIEVKRHLDPALGRVRADPSQLEQVIVNLCVNARDAMPNGGRLLIETANVELDAARSREQGSSATGSYVMLAVSDTGAGMDAETRSRVFEPFFTTKGPEKGTGLGLATVYGVVKQSGGEIWVYSEPGMGSTFKIFLPRLAADDTDADTRESKPAAAGGGRETVLVAEDDASVRRMVERVLGGAGYKVLAASNGDDALVKAAQHPGDIDLLVTDIVMPGTDGRQLASALVGQRASLRVLYLSGYTDGGVLAGGLLPRGEAFLPKPFTADALLQRVRKLVETASKV